MKKNGTLEAKMRAMKKGDSIEVKTPRDRAAAHRIALRTGISIITRAKIIGAGYEIARSL